MHRVDLKGHAFDNYNEDLDTMSMDFWLFASECGMDNVGFRVFLSPDLRYNKNDLNDPNNV